MPSKVRADEFTACWHENVGRVRAYAARHVGPEAAADVAAEAFLQAWRRWDDVPEQPLPWLIGTARKVIGNQRRGNRRGEALVERLALTAAPWSEDPHERREALEALAGLPVADREALLLTSWDGLTPAQAAAVLGVREGTFRVRLHRARTRLEEALTREELPCS